MASKDKSMPSSWHIEAFKIVTNILKKGKVMAPQNRGEQIVKRKNIRTLGSLAMNTHTFLDDL
jgi:hypothetical protein